MGEGEERERKREEGGGRVERERETTSYHVSLSMIGCRCADNEDEKGNRTQRPHCRNHCTALYPLPAQGPEHQGAYAYVYMRVCLYIHSYLSRCFVDDFTSGFCAFVFMYCVPCCSVLVFSFLHHSAIADDSFLNRH